MNKLFPILIIVLFSQCLLKASEADPTFYVQRGNIISRVESRDLLNLKIIEWQVRLYKQGSSKLGVNYWTTITGKTANDVMAKLKRSQDFELNFNAFIGKGKVQDNVLTCFNFLGPIAIVEDPIPEPIHKEGWDKLWDIIHRAEGYYDVYCEVKKNLDKILRTRPPTPYDNVGDLFKEYCDNLRSAYYLIDRIKIVSLNHADNQFEKMNSDISKIDKYFKTLDKLHADIYGGSLVQEKGTKNNNKGSANSFYIFFATSITIQPEPGQFSNLRTPKTLCIISSPVLHTGIPSDPMRNEKESFYSDLEKKFADRQDVLDQLMHNNDNSRIEVHYGKPYSTELLKTEEEGFEAIEAYKNSTKELLEGLAEVDFLILK